MFYVIFFGVPLLTVAWWWVAARMVRSIRGETAWRVGIGAFAVAMLLPYAWVIISRLADIPTNIPLPYFSAMMIWHLFLAPLTAALMLLMALIRGGFSIASSSKATPVPSPAPAREPAPAPVDAPEVDGIPAAYITRRQMLGATLAAAPVVLTGLSTARGLSQLDYFRVRNFDIPIVGLPKGLDGLTIANLSDVHVGRFETSAVLRAMADRANALRPDVVVMTGDLINSTVADLPEAIDMVRRIDPRHGIWLCEGNHDLFDGHKPFEEGLRKAGVPLLLNEQETVRINGEKLQVLGLKWGKDGERRGARIEEHMATLMPLRDPEATQVLLAHHPHAFDLAADAGIHLTLAGHTHGGQLMLTEEVGPGPVMYKYWSGLYSRAGRHLVVSNGVGNWFPLRINAPAEIVVTRLRAT